MASGRATTSEIVALPFHYRERLRRSKSAIGVGVGKCSGRPCYVDWETQAHVNHSCRFESSELLPFQSSKVGGGGGHRASLTGGRNDPTSIKTLFCNSFCPGLFTGGLHGHTGAPKRASSKSCSLLASLAKASLSPHAWVTVPQCLSLLLLLRKQVTGANIVHIERCVTRHSA